MVEYITHVCVSVVIVLCKFFWLEVVLFIVVIIIAVVVVFVLAFILIVEVVFVNGVFDTSFVALSSCVFKQGSDDFLLFRCQAVEDCLNVFGFVIVVMHNVTITMGQSAAVDDRFILQFGLLAIAVTEDHVINFCAWVGS